MTSRFDIRLVAGILSLGLIAGPAAALPLSPSCATPDPVVALNGSLDEALAHASVDGKLTILTIGSSSTEGIGATTPSASYPARLEVELERRLPELAVEVINKGKGGEVVATTAQRLKTEVQAVDPDLVIWQLGTNDAVRGVGSSEFEAIVNDGLAFLAQHDTDVILMDPQLFPRIAEDQAYKGFVDRISIMAGHAGVPLVRRFEAMTHWAKLPEGVRQVMLSGDSFHMNDQGYACLAEMMAEGLSRRIAAAPGGKVLASETKAPAPGKGMALEQVVPEVKTTTATR
jgi:lysophospholipase L1-like esterase